MVYRLADVARKDKWVHRGPGRTAFGRCALGPWIAVLLDEEDNALLEPAFTS